MFFKSIIGQEKLKARMLLQIRNGKWGHASLLVGEHGFGTLPLALAIAQYVNCENPGPEDSCGSCSSCKKNLKLIHPDVHFSFPVNTTKAVKKDPVSDHFIGQWREAILKQPYMGLETWLEEMGIGKKQGHISVNESAEILKSAMLKPFESKHKVFVIWYVEKMSRESSTKLLKIIEEPNPGTIFILVAESSETILPTILSRAQTYKVKGIENNTIVNELKALLEDEAKAGHIANLAEGSWWAAKSMADSEDEGNEHKEAFISWMRLCYSKKVIDLIDWSTKMSAVGREKQKQFFSYALSMLRESLLENYGVNSLSRVAGEEAEFKTNFAPFIHEGNATKLIEEISTASYHIERNGNARIIFLDLSLKVTKLLTIKSVTL